MRIRGLLSVVALASAASAAHADGITCTFSDPMALSRIFGQGRRTYGWWTKTVLGGQLASCSAPYEAGCTNWIQDGIFHLFPAPGYYARLRVEALDDTHFHLPFDDPSLPQCFVPAAPGDSAGDSYGRWVNGVCTKPPADEPRHLRVHGNSKTLSLWVEGIRRQPSFGGTRWVSTGPRLFNLVSFRNRGDIPITLRVKWHDDQWYDWENIPPGVQDVSSWAWSIKEARFFATDMSGGLSIKLDDIVTDNIQH